MIHASDATKWRDVIDLTFQTRCVHAVQRSTTFPWSRIQHRSHRQGLPGDRNLYTHNVTSFVRSHVLLMFHTRHYHCRCGNLDSLCHCDSGWRAKLINHVKTRYSKHIVIASLRIVHLGLYGNVDVDSSLGVVMHAQSCPKT